MRGKIVHFLLLVSMGLVARSQGQRHSDTVPPAKLLDAPLYEISFQRGEPIPGIGAMPMVRLPFECTNDGTVFITMLQPLGAGNRPRNLSPLSLSTLVTSISPSGKAHSFPLDQVPGFNNVTDIEHYASESNVVFLVRATPFDAGRPLPSDNGAGGAPAAVDQHFYVVTFDREGNYQKAIQIEDSFQIYKIGLFPSGTYLAYGFDKADHSPKLALLREDGTVLKYLQIPQDDMPEVALGTLDGSGKGAGVYIAPVQFIGQGHSIYVLQNRTKFPLLEVNEAGAIREVHPKLPPDIQIKILIPSDVNLYARGTQALDKGSIYELDTQSGAVRRRLHVSNDPSGANVACVTGTKFLSFEHAGGGLVPLTGTATPASSNSTPGEN